MSDRIYLDYAATTPVDPEVWEAMSRVAREIPGNPSSIHAEGRAARNAVEESRRNMCRWFGCALSELIFTSCGTESNNTILFGAVRDLGVRRIITSPVEHHCVLHTVEALREMADVDVVHLPVSVQGLPDLDALEEQLRHGSVPTLVSLMWVNNEVGSILNLAAAGEICRKYGAWFHSDTVQGIGSEVLDLQHLPLDFASGSAHKFFGPKGTGFMYIRSGLHLKPHLFGGSQERNLRAGTENVIGIVGMARACELAYMHLDDRRKRMFSLREKLRSDLNSRLPGIGFNGVTGPGSSPKILSVNVPVTPRSELLLLNLDIAGVSASGGSACSSGVESASHVLSHLQIPADQRTVRFSFSHLVTEDQIDRVVDKVADLILEPEMTSR